MTRILIAMALGASFLLLSGCESKTAEDREKTQRRDAPTEPIAAPGRDLTGPDVDEEAEPPADAPPPGG